jgi:hypothetical protein
MNYDYSLTAQNIATSQYLSSNKTFCKFAVRALGRASKMAPFRDVATKNGEKLKAK